MGGGLMQLVAYGAQDVYLTGNPQITFFKVVYRRHTNFSMEVIEHALNGNPDFGRRASVTITRNGDLITRMYLRVVLDHVTPTLNEGVTSKFAWVRRVGHALIKSVEIEIGGSRIDKHYGCWLDIWFELARHAGDGERGYLIMIGDVPALTAYNSLPKQEYILFIPLIFWFNRNSGLALPLIALQYHEVRLHFEFARAEEVIIANQDFKNNDMKCVAMKEATILVDYIYLDSEERRRFAQVGHEYLIEQLQFTGEESAQTQTNKYKLDFNHPTKELIWALKNGIYISGKAFPFYTHYDDWSIAFEEAAQKLLKESITTVAANAAGPQKNGEDNWTDQVLAQAGTVTSVNGQLTITNDSANLDLYVNTNSLLFPDGTSLIDKISGDVLLDANDVLTCTNLTTTFDARCFSFCTADLTDCRYTYDDACVYIWNNYGVLIDGTGNPIEWGLIQLNGHDRFDRREGAYFNYVQPEQHHTNTPADGINVYSFALFPEQHQPSGTANLSRIDNTQLTLWFVDPTFLTGLPQLNFLNIDNKLFIFAINYNVLRIMSGKLIHALKNGMPKVCGYLLETSFSLPQFSKTRIMTSISHLKAF